MRKNTSTYTNERSLHRIDQEQDTRQRQDKKSLKKYKEPLQKNVRDNRYKNTNPLLHL